MELLENKMTDIEAGKIRLELEEKRTELIKEFEKIQRYFDRVKSDFEFRKRIIKACHENPKLYPVCIDDLDKEL